MMNSTGEIYIDNELFQYRNSPEAYRTQHFPKPVKTLTLDEIWYLMEHAKVTFPITVKSILCHAYNFEDARLSLEQLRCNRPEYWR